MRKTAVAILALALTMFVTSLIVSQAPKQDDKKADDKKAAVPDTPTMSDRERGQLRQLLNLSQKEFLDAVENLNDAQWNFKSPPIDGRERWSIAQCAEHIVLAEGLLFSQVEAAMAAPAIPDWQTKTAGKTPLLLKVMPDRSHKAEAPEAIQPRQPWTREETIAKYKAARAKTIKYAETTDDEVKSHVKDHPFPVFGTLSAYQWLIYIPLHNMRHNQQILEVKTYAGYPK